MKSKNVMVEVLPRDIEILGKRLYFEGWGAYPYPCREQDVYPRAAIYKGEGGWITNESEFFKNRDISKDNQGALYHE